MTKDGRSPWHRDDLPAWAWVALVLARLGQLVALLLPFALAALLWWTWEHRRDPEVRRVLRGAAKQVTAIADSVRSVLR
jgi:hypothetical protein